MPGTALHAATKAATMKISAGRRINRCLMAPGARPTLGDDARSLRRPRKPERSVGWLCLDALVDRVPDRE